MDSPPNANQEVSNTNHFGSVSGRLGPLAVASECMASNVKIDNCHATRHYSIDYIMFGILLFCYKL